MTELRLAGLPRVSWILGATFGCVIGGIGLSASHPTASTMAAFLIGASLGIAYRALTCRVVFSESGVVAYNLVGVRRAEWAAVTGYSYDEMITPMSWAKPWYRLVLQCRDGRTVPVTASIGASEQQRQSLADALRAGGIEVDLGAWPRE